MGVHIRARIPEGATDHFGEPRTYLTTDDLEITDDDGNDLVGPLDIYRLDIQSGDWYGDFRAVLTVRVNSIDISPVPLRIENGTHNLGQRPPTF